MNDLTRILKGTRKHLMNGVSYMLPFVVAGGVLLAVSVALYGQGGTPPEGTFLYDLFNLGGIGLGYMVPVFSAYIAYSIADRAGIAPGMIGGALAGNIGAGFLGGILSGLAAGIICFYLKKIHVPKAIKSIMPIIIIPITASFLLFLLMQYVIGQPIAGLMDMLANMLENLSGSNKILMGLVMGAMIGFDLGGPVNKVAFSFGVATVGMGIYTYAAPMAVAICTPPIGMGIATFIAKKKFTQEERDAGKSAVLMGAVGISEGAIPFAGNDPIRVIASTVVGSVVGGAVAYALNTTCAAAWGGLIVLPVVGNKLGYCIAVLVGSLVTAFMVILLKKDVKEETAKGGKDDEELDIEFEL